MPNTKELRTRIRSVKNTAQITKAMQMVSATKMRRAQNQALAGRDYNRTLSSILSTAGEKISNHPLMRTDGALDKGNPHKAAVLLLTSDRGLAGSLNTNIIRTAQTSTQITAFKDLTYFTIGKKGRDYIVRTGQRLEADFESQEKVQFRQAVSVRRMLVESYLKGEFTAIFVVYPDFISTLRQEPTVRQLLPIDPQALQQFLNDQTESTSKLDYIFEPTLTDVIEYALIHYLDTTIYQALLETKASEHSARMIAMQNATNNAKELVDDLTLEYNQVRQSAITTQILEIASAGAALE